MGGNLFKVGRVDKDRYFEILDSLRPVLDRHFGDRYRIPVAYRNKPDYGDVDIIVDAATVLNNPTWKEDISHALNVSEVKSVRNVYSMLYQNFQVDLFLVGSNKLETCNNFMSYNILGNLIGRVYHKFNLRYGEDGLFYVLRGFNNHISKEVIVSKDMKSILEFIGLSYERWLEGFDDVQDIFDYIITSKYFCSNSYDLKYFNIQKRATERPEFNKFLDYLSWNNINKNYPFDKNKEVYLDEIDAYFNTNLKEKYKEHVERQAILQKLSKKFNGKIVMEVIEGIEGKELGKFISDYKNACPNFERDILLLPQEIINNDIKTFYESWKTQHTTLTK